MSEKEYNGLLYDQLAMLDRLNEIAMEQNDTAVINSISKERNWIKMKLYQDAAPYGFSMGEEEDDDAEELPFDIDEITIKAGDEDEIPF